MNLRLSEQRIRDTCRELLREQGHVSGRGLCTELRRRFGAIGKTTRVFAIWREVVVMAPDSRAAEMDRLQRTVLSQVATIRTLRARILTLNRELGILRSRR